MDAGFKLRSSLASQESETRAQAQKKEHSMLSESLSKAKRSVATFATIALTSLAVTNNSNNYTYGSAFQGYYYVIPTLTTNDIEVKNNKNHNDKKIYIDGKEFILFDRRSYYKPGGTKNRPFSEQQIGIGNKEYGTPSDGLADMTMMLKGKVNDIWKMDSRGQTLTLDKSVANYKGLGYYCFQVGINVPYQSTENGSGEEIIYLETPKPATYKKFLYDVNLLYKLNKNNAQFYGTTNQEFVREFMEYEGYLKTDATYSNFIGEKYSKSRNVVYSLFGNEVNVKLPKLQILKFSKDYRFKLLNEPNFEGAFNLYRGVPLKYVKYFVPGYGDGSKTTPFKVTYPEIKWRGSGYYFFPKIYGGLGLETMYKVYSKSYLKAIAKRVCTLDNDQSIPGDNLMYYGVSINGKMFFYGQQLLTLINKPDKNVKNNKLSKYHGMYQDGSIEHPYLSLKFTKKGRYFIINCITPVIKSEKQYKEISSMLKRSQRIKDIIKDNDSEFSTIPSNILFNSLLYYHMLQNREIRAKVESAKQTYIMQTRLMPVVHIKKPINNYILLENPNDKKTQDIKNNEVDKKTYQNIKINGEDIQSQNKNIKIKDISGTKFYLTTDKKYANERTGSEDNPFLSNEGPRGKGYYQIAGTDFMTSVPINGKDLGKWLGALHRKEDQYFDVSKSFNMDGNKIHKEYINKFEVFEYKKPYTENFGTLTEPYFLNESGARNFVVGTPSYFLIKYSGKQYVNSKRIKTMKELREFYNKITGKVLNKNFVTKNEGYAFR